LQEKISGKPAHFSLTMPHIVSCNRATALGKEQENDELQAIWQSVCDARLEQ